MSASFLEKINIFYLLGIEKLPDADEKKFVADMTKIIFETGLAQSLQKEKIPTDVYNKLLEILEEENSGKETDSIKLQRYIMDNVPNIREHLYDATMKFKHDSFLAQLKDVESRLTSITDETERNYLQDTITKLRNNLEVENEEEFINNHKVYTDLKIKHNLD